MGYSKDYYHFCKEHGICVRCHKEKAIYKLFCGKCKEKEDALRLNKPKRTGEEREKYNQHLKDYRSKLKQEGICIWCAKKKAVEGKTLCLECSLKKRNSKKKYDKRKGNYSIPWTCRIKSCNNIPVEGKCYCEEHLKMYAEIGKENLYHVNKENHPWRKLNAVDAKKALLNRKSELVN